jgi:hypothetical protein
MEKGFPETEILMPFRMSRETSPLRRPVADPFVVFCGSSSREMGDPCIDPSDGIRDICAIDGDMIAHEEIFCNILFHPLPILIFLLNGPSPIPHGPDLKRGFIDRQVPRKHRLAGGVKGHNI